MAEALQSEWVQGVLESGAVPTLQATGLLSTPSHEEMEQLDKALGFPRPIQKAEKSLSERYREAEEQHHKDEQRTCETKQPSLSASEDAVSVHVLHRVGPEKKKSTPSCVVS